MQAFNVMFAVSALVKQYPDHLNFSTHIKLPKKGKYSFQNKKKLPENRLYVGV